jgi:site-specific recombinase XerD
MGVFIRSDSPYYQLLLERPGDKPLRRPTKIPHSPSTKLQRVENRRLAEQAYHDAMQALAKGDLGHDDGYTKRFSDMERWYRLHRLPKRRGARRELDLLRHLAAFFGDTLLRKITPARVDEYETHRLAQHAAPGTINREVDHLKTMMRIAAENKWAPPKLLYGKRKLHVPKTAKARLTPEQEHAILAAIRHPNDRALVIMGIDTLTRQGDLLDFRRAHDHITTADIVDPKNGRFLNVPISPRLRTALNACEPDPAGSDYYFWQRRKAKNPRDWGASVRTMFKAACRKANVPFGRKLQAITFHRATRATGASRMLARGADLKTVQSIGGWADVRSMDPYLTAEDANRQAAVRLVSAITPQSRRDRIKRAITEKQST